MPTHQEPKWLRMTKKLKMGARIQNAWKELVREARERTLEAPICRCGKSAVVMGELPADWNRKVWIEKLGKCESVTEVCARLHHHLRAIHTDCCREFQLKFPVRLTLASIVFGATEGRACVEYGRRLPPLEHGFRSRTVVGLDLAYKLKLISSSCKFQSGKV